MTAFAKPSRKRTAAEALLKSGPHTKKQIKVSTGAHQVTVAAWFAVWQARKMVCIAGRAPIAATGTTPLLWEWAHND